MLDRAGEIVAIMQVFVRPPSESCSKRVSFDSLTDGYLDQQDNAFSDNTPVWNMRGFINQSIYDAS